MSEQISPMAAEFAATMAGKYGNAVKVFLWYDNQPRAINHGDFVYKFARDAAHYGRIALGEHEQRVAS